MAETNNLPTKAQTNPPQSRDEVEALLERARRGDQSCLPQLRALFADGKRGSWYVEALGSPPAWLFDSLAKSAAGKDLAVREALERNMERVRRDLEGPDPTPIERLLAERAAICWAEVNLRGTIYEQARDLTIRQAEFHQRRIDAAHRRFLSAVRTLATVRKLAAPSLRINVAKNQVNVG